MQNNNYMKGLFFNRNIQPSHEGKNKIIEKKKEKEKLSHSQRTFNKNNHVHYYSKSSNQTNLNINKEKEISKKLSFNDIEDDEELDHPKPLISDEEEDIDNLKNIFNKKIKKNPEKSKKNENKGLNLKFNPKSSGFEKINELPSKNSVNNEKKMDNCSFVPTKKNYKSETMSKKQISHIKAQINNKMNYIISNDDIINHNTDKKNIPMKKRNQELNNNKRKKYEYTTYKNSNENFFSNISMEPLNNFSGIINENYNYVNIPNQTNNNMNSLNQRTQINNKSQMIKNQKQQMQTICIPNNKNIINNPNEVKIKEEYEKKCSKDKYFETEPNIYNTINNNSQTTKMQISQVSQNNSQIKNNLKKSINIKNINNLFSKEENQKFKSERNKDKENRILVINEVDVSNKQKIQNELGCININNANLNKENKSLNLQKTKSSEIKNTVCFEKNIFYNKLEGQNNSKYRKKTFERGGIFNNIQTTYIVISKKKSMKYFPKTNLSNITPEIIDNNKYKFINPTPSTNCLYYSKLCKGSYIPQRYSTDLNFKRVNVNEQKKFGLNNSHNNLPVKRYNDYNNLVVNKLNINNYDTNYKNYVESFISGHNGDKGRNTCLLNNKIDNTNNSNFYDYDFNYEYYL